MPATLDFIAEYEAELEARAKEEIAREDAAWAALPQSEKDRIIADRDARLSAMADAAEESEEEDEDEDDQED